MYGTDTRVLKKESIMFDYICEKFFKFGEKVTKIVTTHYFFNNNNSNNFIFLIDNE